MSYQRSASSELSHLRRAIFYPPTGTGRDSYIMVNNGGTSAPIKLQGVPKSGNFMKFGRVYSSSKPVSMDRHKRYVSDGTGRDNYISSKWEAPQTVSEKVRMFRQSLRDGQCFRSTNWKSTVNPQKNYNLVRKLSIPKRKQQKYALKLQQLKNGTKSSL